jgi:hypothetical protein
MVSSVDSSDILVSLTVHGIGIGLVKNSKEMPIFNILSVWQVFACPVDAALCFNFAVALL